MRALIDTLARLDETGEHGAAIRLIAETRLGPAALVEAAFTLYTGRRDTAALLLAARLADEGVGHWLPDAVSAHLAAAFNLADRIAPALRTLERRLAGLDAESLATCRATVGWRLGQDVAAADPVRDADRILRLLEVAKLIRPELAALFPGPAAVPGGPAPAANRLLSFAAPEPPGDRRPRSAVVAVRDHWNPGNPRSRPLDLGPRLVAAMTAYGWTAAGHGVRSFHDAGVVAADCAALTALCLETRADLLILDEVRLDLPPAAILSEFLAGLRRLLPGLRVVALYLDPWDRERWPGLEAAAGLIDAVWAPFPSLELWRRPAFADRMLFCPFPPGPPREPTEPAGGLRPSFVGGVEAVNWTRNVWLAALARTGLDVEVIRTSHRDDGLPALDSFRRYLDRLAATGCALNFSMRHDGSRPLTGRVFEATWSGALLIQEAAGDVDAYFTSGEHILTFTTFTELAEAVRLVRDRPDAADAIRRRGHAFARDRYSDERIIGALDQRLFSGRCGR